MRFLLDSVEIFRRTKTVTSFRAFGDSFDNLAWVIRNFGLTRLTYSLLGFSVSSVALLLALWKAPARSLGRLELVLVLFWFAAQTVYIGLPSKEVVISLVIFIAFVFNRSKYVVPIFVICATLVTVYFRTYWGIILVATMVLYLGPTFFRKPLFLGFFILLLFFVVAFVFQNQYGSSLDFARQQVNESRDPDEIASMIVPFIDGSGIGVSVANVALTFCSFVLPVRLLTSGIVSQIGGGIGVFFTFALLLSRYRRAAAVFPVERFDKLCFCFTIMFVATQAIFEPDYGSFVRHLSPMSPMLLYMIIRLRVIIPKRGEPLEAQ